jgi:hypothetical protein
VTRAELLSQANRYAAQLGAPLITERQVGDWRDEELLPPPIARGAGRGRGVERDWSEALEALKTIIRLRAMGERRATQFRSYLWIAGFPIDPPRAREAIISEFGRMIARQRRELRETDVAPTEFARAALMGRIGPLDPDLARVATFIETTPRNEPLALSALPEMITGEAGLSAIAAACAARVPIVEMGLDVPELAALLAGFSGFFGLPDETDKSAIDVLSMASETELEAARSTVAKTFFVLRIFLAAFFPDDTQLERKVLSLDRTEWAISIFVQALNGAEKIKIGRRKQALIQ